MFYTKTNHLDKLMDEAFKVWPLWETTVTTKSSEYHAEKTDTEYVLELPVPGLSKEDLSVKLVSGKLEIKVENEEHRWTPNFEKNFLLPKDINTKKVEASVENGVLTIKIGIDKESETIVEII
jgi:HSP20 family protein